MTGGIATAKRLQMASFPRHDHAAAAFAIAAAGVAAFAAMDALMKLITLSLGAYNAVLWRILTSIPINGSLYALSGMRRPAWPVVRLHLLRGAVNAASALGFFWGLARMPIAEAIALAFIAPIVAQYLAVLMLGERFRVRTIVASLIGLTGVAVILWAQLDLPDGQRDARGALAILLSATLYALNLVLLRRQAQAETPQEVTFFQTVAVALCLGLAAPFLIVLPAASEWPTLLVAALLMTIATLAFAWAYRRAETQYLATVEYSALIWAALFGYLLFGEEIMATTIIGALLIVAGCLLAAGSARGPRLSPAEGPA